MVFTQLRWKMIGSADSGILVAGFQIAGAYRDGCRGLCPVGQAGSNAGKRGFLIFSYFLEINMPRS